MENSLSRTRLELFVLFILYLVLLPRVYMDYDMGFTRQWALYIHQHGLTAAYAQGSPINYFPVFVYVLYFYDLLQGTEARIAEHINSIKILFVCFDFLPLVMLCGFRRRLLQYQIPHLFLLLNIAYVFNSLVWGQIDSMYTSLAFLAIVAGISYPVPAVLLYLLALNTKPQAIEFLPVMFIVLSYSIRNSKTVFFSVASAIALQLLILLPFISSGGPSRLWYFASHAVGLYHNLSISAFNFWYLATRGNPYFIADTDTWFILSYRAAGLVFFSAAVLWIFLPLFRRIRLLASRRLSFDGPSYRLLFLGAGLICLYFFYFNSQMHERYAQPVIILFFFYGVVSGNYRLYVLASIPYFLSLDKSFSFPDGYLPVVHYKIIWASKMIALWYTVTVAYGSLLYYREILNYPPLKEPAAAELPV